MSVTVIKLIPSDPEFVPNESELLAVKDWMEANFHDNDGTTYTLTDEVRFIDQGENFESIYCPCCSKQIDTSWWQHQMDEAYKTSFHNLQIVMDCCGRIVSLNDLDYRWAAGFARFSIEIMNPQNDFTDQLVTMLGQVLQCSFKKVIAHY